MESKSWVEKLLPSVEFDRFGWISMLIILVGCLGGVAVGLGALQSTIQLSLAVAVTMLTLVLVLAVSPMKYIMNASLLAVIVHLILIAINLF